eukprot:COSAG01_NODE_11571_length_1901_cov_321.830000_1_plen_191_part_10
MANCTELQNLTLTGCRGLKDLSVLAKCHNLQSLSLTGCQRLTNLSELANCSNLQNLSLIGCREVKDLSVLAKCHNLQSLSLTGCQGLTNLSGLENCTELQHLSIYECFQLDITTLDVQTYQTLKTLKIMSNRYIKLPKEWVDGLFQHPTLEDITLRSKEHSNWIMSKQLLKEAIRLKNLEQTDSSLTPLQK